MRNCVNFLVLCWIYNYNGISISSFHGEGKHISIVNVDLLRNNCIRVH